MISFYYFDGCPNAEKTWDNLKFAQNILEIPAEEIERIEVPDISSAEKVLFQGSPSILIDGIDIYTGSKPKGFHYACRVYNFDKEQTGIIPQKFIQDRYIALTQK